MTATRVRTKPAGRYHHGELRRALLDATLAIVAREGTGAVSLRAIARRVGVSPQATYNHFSAKSALLAAAAEEGVRELERRTATARDAVAPGEPGRRLEAIGVAYVDFAIASSAHFRLLAAPELVDRAAHPGLVAAYADAFAVLVGAVEDCQRAGVVRAGDTRKFAYTAWALVHGVAWLVVNGETIDAREAMRTLSRGLADLPRKTATLDRERPRRPRS